MHPRGGYFPMARVGTLGNDALRLEAAAVPVPARVRSLRSAAWLAGATAVLAAVAAGAEAWRFVLLLRGRTTVLSGTQVRISDALLASVSVGAAALGVLTAVILAVTVSRLHPESARWLGRPASRPPGAVWARLVVPGWNLLGAGQLLAEVDSALRRSFADRHPTIDRDDLDGATTASGRPRPPRLLVAWWSAWVLNGVLAAAVLLRGTADGLQAQADTVELHVAVDLVAAVVAGLTVAVCRRFAGLLDPPAGRGSTWVVAPPRPTRTAPLARSATAGD